MPPQLLVDPSTYDLNKVIMTLEEIRKYNAQRFEMEQLSGVLKFDADAGEGAFSASDAPAELAGA